MNRSATKHHAFSTDRLHAALSEIGGPARPDYLPDVVAQAARMRQRPAWTFLERWLPMDIAVRRQGVLRAAVLFAVLFLLVALLAAGVVYVGSPRPVALPADGDVDPGWHAVTVDGYRYTFRVPGAGWKKNVVPAPQAEVAPPNVADVELTQGDASNDLPDLAGFGLWGNATGVYRARCQEVYGAGGMGPTADDLATAIASLDGFRSSGPTDVTVGRYGGKRLQLAVIRDRWAGCTAGGGTYRYAYESFTDEDGKSRQYQGPEQIDDIWILDLDNGHRQLFLITYFPTTPAERVDELRQMVESVQVSPIEGIQ
jgi:hypothetical protein